MRLDTADNSRNACHDGSPSRFEAYQQVQDHDARYERSSQERNTVPKVAETPAYHQAVGLVIKLADNRYEVITTKTDVIMVMEFAGEELFNYIVQKGKGGVGVCIDKADDRCRNMKRDGSFSK